MGQYYLAIDIGTSSGRHILGYVENGKILLEEVYRFPNSMLEKDGHKCWDVDALFDHILEGMKKCKLLGKIPVSVGIDTWAVDFVLLDGDGNRIGDVVGYRDNRTDGMDRLVCERISELELYSVTGIQKQPFNTIYQLMALAGKHPEQLDKAETLLMIPEYFYYLLTGKIVAEYTNATTTQLVNAKKKNWDWKLIEKLGYPDRIFQNLNMPGTLIGRLSREIAKDIGYNCNVILAATHDTASSVMAVPTDEENAVYISSGTWSLMGTELSEADCSEESRQKNFTNEGGYDYRFRYLKNIMGLWMIQSVRKELAPEKSFGEICEAAAKTDIMSCIDCNHIRFLAPANMTEEIQKACHETKQAVPEGIAEVASVVYQSLAKCYAESLKEIEQIRGIHFEKIHVIGGGANADYLNKLTAKKTGCNVWAGPVESTAIGNLSAQMIAAGEFLSLQDVRQCIRDSFEIKIYQP